MIEAIILRITVSCIKLQNQTLKNCFIKQGLKLLEVGNLVSLSKLPYFRVQCVLEMRVISQSVRGIISTMSWETTVLVELIKLDFVVLDVSILATRSSCGPHELL